MMKRRSFFAVAAGLLLTPFVAIDHAWFRSTLTSEKVLITIPPERGGYIDRISWRTATVAKGGDLDVRLESLNPCR